MLSIVFKSKYEWTWYIGQVRPSLRDDFYDCVDQIAYVYADGHELTYAVEKLGMRHNITKRGTNWFGDDAKYVAGNI